MSRTKSIKVTRVCQTCNNEFLTKESEVARGGGLYCSRQCYYKSQAIPIEVHFRNGIGITTDSGCILWQGVTDHNGYGVISSSTHRRGQRTFSAHRVGWELTHGPIDKGLYVCHTCDVPLCVNVEHLFLGTQSDNMQDMARKGRHWHATLTPEIIRCIRSRYAAGGISQKQLADEYQTDQTNISKIVRCTAWKHVV